jgi:hypothetical protein
MYTFKIIFVELNSGFGAGFGLKKPRVSDPGQKKSSGSLRNRIHNTASSEKGGGILIVPLI